MRPIRPHLSSLTRRVSIAFPPYRYVPGLSPHPIQHEDGHMAGKNMMDCQSQENRQLLWAYGLDLFDFQYMWEAHEVWERLWHYHRQEIERASLIQGMILGAAACLKHEMQAEHQACRLLRRARQKIDMGKGLSIGIDLFATMDSVEDFLGGGVRPNIVNTQVDGWRNWP